MEFPKEVTQLYVIDTRLGTKEGREHEKILYYYPPSVPINLQTQRVGLSEALVHLASVFSKTPLEILRTEQQTNAFLPVEEHYWIVLGLANPTITKKKSTTVEFDEEFWDEKVVRSCVSQAYRMYKLFYGPLERTLQSEGLDALKNNLATLLESFLYSTNFKELTLFSSFEGIQFLPVDKNVYLRVQSFVNNLEFSLPNIAYVSFMYKNGLVWSGLEQEDIRILYKYVCDVFVNPERPNPLPGPYLSAERSRGNFLTGLEADPLRVHIGPDATPHYLAIYRNFDVYLIFLLNEKADANVLQRWPAHIDPILDNPLSRRLKDFHSRKHAFEDQYKYLYFNRMNLAMKTSYGRSSELEPKIIQILHQMHSDFEGNAMDQVSEFMYRTHTDLWVVGKKSDDREFYVIFDNKNANLQDINEEVKKLGETYFKNIFID